MGKGGQTRAFHLLAPARFAAIFFLLTFKECGKLQEKSFDAYHRGFQIMIVLFQFLMLKFDSNDLILALPCP